MCAPALGFLVSALSLAALAGCSINDRVRVQSFTPGPDGNFIYSVHTNPVITENDDGAAEQIRRDWLAQTLEAEGRCRGGYQIYRRTLVVPPQRVAYIGPPDELTFGNGGDVVYNGSCL
jgi:hypothetical protein